MASKYLHDSFVHNTNAAEKIIPFLFEVFKPESVVDIGCGTGTWLKVCVDNGVFDILGIEGHHLDTARLVIPREFVIQSDLEKNFVVNKRFDIAICLEVAEHLDPAIARQFIEQVTSLSDVVLFSAAIPHQGGQNHINEQWITYWGALFTKCGFQPYDIIRPRFWETEGVEFWYAQNSCIFVKHPEKWSVLNSFSTFNNKNLVHPLLFQKTGEYKQALQQGKVSFRFIFKLMAKKIIRIFNRN